MLPTHRQPTHPGEILLEEFLKPLELTSEVLATHLEIPTQEINEIIEGQRAIAPEMAWLFSQAFQTSPEFWMNLQTQYDLCLSRPKSSKLAIALV
ncbi:MAG: HigA family addiction module antidote protein [Cyanobacteria bacterium SBLK]|nr:HigA family addiction module antidote protein [Cyanobacteria bacterium SBLK]